MIRVFASLLVTLSLSVAAADYGPYQAEYVRNYDADTITLNIHIWPDLQLRDINVRLIGVDTPEINSAKCDQEKQEGRAARDWLKRQLEGHTVTIMVHTVDQYGRPIVSMDLAGWDVSDELIRLGYGVPYDGKERRSEDWCD